MTDRKRIQRVPVHFITLGLVIIFMSACVTDGEWLFLGQPSDTPSIPNANLDSNPTKDNQSILINNGAMYAFQPQVTLSITSTIMFEMRVSNKSDLSDASWQAYASEIVWNLEGALGETYVYVQVRDSYGIVSSIFSDSIIYWNTTSNIFISTNGEDTAGCGEIPLSPCKTINFGLQRSQESMGTRNTILVEEGIYNEAIRMPSGYEVTMRGGLYNRFTETDWMHHKTIVNGGTSVSDTITSTWIIDGLAFSEDTILSGFHILGCSECPVTDTNTGLYIANGASPSISNSYIHGGKGTVESVGIWIESSNPKIINGTLIDGGDGPSRSAGIYAKLGFPSITGCTISGGNASESYGIALENTLVNTTIQKNTAISGGTLGTSAGIYLFNAAQATISTNEWIGGGEGEETYGILCTGEAVAKIATNGIHGGSGSIMSVGIEIYGANTAPSVTSNEIHGGSSSTASAGIHIHSKAKPTIDGNLAIQSGEQAETGYGIAIQNMDTKPSIFGNPIYATGGSERYGLFIENAAPPVIYQNYIYTQSKDATGLYYSGSSMLTFAALNLHVSGEHAGQGAYLQGPYVLKNNFIHLGACGTQSIGVYALKPGFIVNNTINAGSYTTDTVDSFTVGILISQSGMMLSTLKILNNVIYAEGGTSSVGIYEDNLVTNPTQLMNNLIFDFSAGIYYDFQTSTYIKDLNADGNLDAELQSVPALPGAGTIANNITLTPTQQVQGIFADTSTYSILPGSRPTGRGMDASDPTNGNVTYDIDGEPRPSTAPDMGCDEV